MSTITLGERFWPAQYLSPEDRHRYDVFVQAEARRLHNPFVDFQEKIKVLSTDLQAVALREFMQSDDYRAIPESALIMATGTLEAIKVLFGYVTGSQDYDEAVTPLTANAIWSQCIEFIARDEVVVEGIEEVNALRAKNNLPPIGNQASEPAVGG